MKKGQERGTQNRPYNYQIGIYPDGSIRDFLDGSDSANQFTGRTKNERFTNFLIAHPDILRAIKNTNAFKDVEAVKIAAAQTKYMDEPFILDGDKALVELQKLPKTTIQEAIVKCSKIPAFAFTGCVALKKLTLEQGVKVIGGAAFANCPLLPSLVLPDTLETIGASAFSGCVGLKGSVRLPDSVTEIQTEAFQGTHIKLAINKERKEKLKVDVKDAD